MVNTRNLRWNYHQQFKLIQQLKFKLIQFKFKLEFIQLFLWRIRLLL